MDREKLILPNTFAYYNWEDEDVSLSTLSDPRSCAGKCLHRMRSEIVRGARRDENVLGSDWRLFAVPI